MENKGTHLTEKPIEEFLDKFIVGNSVDVMKSLPSESIDVVVTSPPYNLKNSTGNGMKDGRGGKWANASLMQGYSDHPDDLPHEDYVAWQRESLKEMYRLIKPDGAIFYNHKWRVQAGLLQDRADIVEGFPVRQIIIWRRSGGINFNPGYFLPTFEVIYLIAKPKFKLTPKANAHGDVWEFSQEFKNSHPAPFPLDFAKRCVASAPGDIVLDPFMGSGTTALAARQLGKKFIGIDISDEYSQTAQARLDDYEVKRREMLFEDVHQGQPQERAS